MWRGKYSFGLLDIFFIYHTFNETFSIETLYQLFIVNRSINEPCIAIKYVVANT